MANRAMGFRMWQGLEEFFIMNPQIRKKYSLSLMCNVGLYLFLKDLEKHPDSIASTLNYANLEKKIQKEEHKIILRGIFEERKILSSKSFLFQNFVSRIRRMFNQHCEKNDILAVIDNYLEQAEFVKLEPEIIKKMVSLRNMIFSKDNIGESRQFLIAELTKDNVRGRKEK